MTSWLSVLLEKCDPVAFLLLVTDRTVTREMRSFTNGDISKMKPSSTQTDFNLNYSELKCCLLENNVLLPPHSYIYIYKILLNSIIKSNQNTV